MHATKWFTAEFADDFVLVWLVMLPEEVIYAPRDASDQREVEKFV